MACNHYGISLTEFSKNKEDLASLEDVITEAYISTRIIGEYQEYIDMFLMLIAPEPVEKIKCSACSYENNLVFTFTSILNDCSIEKRFYKFLISKGIKVKIESNGVLDVISTNK